METFPVIHMALGMSKLFGIDLLRNFNYPYFSRDIAEFWVVGTYPCRPGSGLPISRWEAVREVTKQVRYVFLFSC
jgi:hypothetical protein